MQSIKELAVLLTKSLEEQDMATFKRCRIAIVSELADNDYVINSTENLFEMPSVHDNLIVGKALTVILFDMAKSGLLYRRVAVSAMYCLIKTIINDKAGLNKETAVASVFLLILFQENQDFICGEYIAQFVGGDVEVAVHQFIGMTSVFYYMYKLSSFSVELDNITDARLQKALNKFPLQIPDESSRRRIVDFEYDNFDIMSKSMPLDFELKYPGVPFFDPDVVVSKIEKMFGNSLMYFQTKNNASYNHVENKAYGHSALGQNTIKHTKTSSNETGCLSVIVLIIMISLFGII